MRHFLIFIISTLSACSNPQTAPDVINSPETYREQVAQNPDMELVDLAEVVEGIVLDIRYATNNNFTGKVIYPEARAFARKPVAEALVGVQDSLRKLGLGLKIFDAYRPYSATVAFYEIYPDTNFVASPRYGSRHNRGCAVDLTLIALETGNELPMPTPFDDFTEMAHPEFMDLPQGIIQNRTLLINIMQHYGFTPYPTEWWHFDYNGWENYPLMDLSFDQI